MIDDHDEPQPLEITVRRLPDYAATVVAICGEIDVSTVAQLRTTMTEAIQGSKAGDVAVLDLSEVSFLDSSGLGMLVGARKRAGEVGMTWRLCGLRPQLQQLLHITRLDAAFPTYLTVHDALTYDRDPRL